MRGVEVLTVVGRYGGVQSFPSKRPRRRIRNYNLTLAERRLSREAVVKKEGLEGGGDEERSGDRLKNCNGGLEGKVRAWGMGTG